MRSSLSRAAGQREVHRLYHRFDCLIIVIASARSSSFRIKSRLGSCFARSRAETRAHYEKIIQKRLRERRRQPTSGLRRKASSRKKSRLSVCDYIQITSRWYSAVGKQSELGSELIVIKLGELSRAVARFLMQLWPFWLPPSRLTFSTNLLNFRHTCLFAILGAPTICRWRPAAELIFPQVGPDRWMAKWIELLIGRRSASQTLSIIRLARDRLIEPSSAILLGKVH